MSANGDAGRGGSNGPEYEGELVDPDAAAEPAIDFYGGKWMSALPLALFVVWAVVQSGLLRIGDTTGLVMGMLVALIVGIPFVRGDWKTYANTIFEGMTRRVAATAIVAWL